MSDDTDFDAGVPLRDAYDANAAVRLRLLSQHVERLADESVDAFYRDLAQDPRLGPALRGLGDAALGVLKERQAAHLRGVASPDATRDSLIERARADGGAYALIGVTSSLLVNAQSLHRSVLSAVLERAEMDGGERYGLLQIIDARLQDAMEAQSEAREAVIAAYFGTLSQPFAAPSTPWPDIYAEELGGLGRLPAVRGVLLLRLNQDGILVVEFAAGPNVREIAQVMQSPVTGVVIDPSSPRGRGLAALAWRTRQTQSTASYADDPRLQFWAETARRLAVQSTFAIPVLDAEGHPIACIYLYGSHPNQFESDWMREFGRGLQRRWEQTWERSRTVGAFALPQAAADTMRECVFGDGLTMFAQPIVDLRDGTVHSIEVLARLRLADGTIVVPGQFLPLLGNAELERLFQVGLDRILQWLGTDGKAFPDLCASINMAPSTLLNPQCLQWLRDGVRKHNVAPDRLYIEVLEDHDLHSTMQRKHIEELAGAGFKLSMDDLGSGYSSLERLARLPFDAIKIDQGLLSSVSRDPEGVLSLVGSLIQMVGDLRREAVVEGLERDDFVEAVRILGAPLGQGYGISRPMPLDHTAAWLRSYTPPPVDGAIRTPLGALAYHWRFLRALDSPKLHADLADCPLTQFFATVAPNDAAIHRWHAQVHAGENVGTASHLLNDWLLRRLRAGRTSRDTPNVEAAPAQTGAAVGPNAATVQERLTATSEGISAMDFPLRRPTGDRSDRQK